MALLKQFLSNQILCSKSFVKNFQRFYGATITGTDKCSTPHSRGLVLGVYSNEKDKLDIGQLTKTAQKYNLDSTKGRLLELLRIAGPMPKRGECRLFYNLEPRYSAVAVCGLGDKCLGFNAQEMRDEGKEAIRIASATGCKALQMQDTNKIYVESFDHPESAAEGACMSVWSYQDLKSKKKRQYVPQVAIHSEKGLEPDREAWTIGLHKASAQNLARQLMEIPANLLTPTTFAQKVVNVLCDSGVNVEVKVRSWAESMRMNAFLAIAKGSCQPPIFLELSYEGAHPDEAPIVLVGQGNTYDSGGICTKQIGELQHMRGDMCGAACVVATCRAIASLRLPVNVRGLIPLCEHMLGCNAIKPGDVVTAMNGKTIEVEDTDNEGPVVVVDALVYAQGFGPKYIIDIGTMSHHIDSALGASCCGVFTNSEYLWQHMKRAAVHTGDRVWRMPLWKHFTRQVRSSSAVDVQNYGIGRGGGACKIAAILREFVQCGQWMHMDAHGIMLSDGKDVPYLHYGMAGRPTRTLIEFIAQTVCQGDGRNK